MEHSIAVTYVIRITHLTVTVYYALIVPENRTDLRHSRGDVECLGEVVPCIGVGFVSYFFQQCA